MMPLGPCLCIAEDNSVECSCIAERRTTFGGQHLRTTLFFGHSASGSADGGNLHPDVFHPREQLNGLTFAAEANAAATYTARMKAPPLSAYTVGGTRKEEMDKEGGRLPWATLRISACPSGTNSTRGVMSHTGAYCPEKDATWNHFDANNCPVPDLAGREVRPHER